MIMKMQYKLSIIITSRNEEWLEHTIQDVLDHTNKELTNVITILDGWIPNPQIRINDPRLTIIYNPISKGQRAGVKQGVNLSNSKYICKLDAHCSISDNFDAEIIKGMEELGDNVTMIPMMRNLHVFDWVCPEGHRHYQSNKNICDQCGKEMIKDVIWFVKPSPTRFTFTFDKDMHFQYDSNQAKKPESVAQGNYRETMSIQGSCYILTKERYLTLDIDSDEFNSWGQNGVEVACKTWLSGGRVIANLNTWYAHMFRTNNFGGFPYSNPESLIQHNRELSKELFKNNKWPLAIRPFEWLLDHFRPVPYWHDKDTKGIIFYTDSQLDERIAKPVRDQLEQVSKDKQIPIVSASLKKLELGKNIRFPSLRKSYEAMFKQIIGALENSSSDYIFFTEHDVIYHPSHFDFIPEDKSKFYFNNNVWKVDIKTGKTLRVDKCEQLSGMCVYRETALNWARDKYEQILTLGFDRHFEPQQILRGSWESAEPNIDLRHDNNLTPNRWSKDQFKNQDNTIGWTEGTIYQLWAKDIFTPIQYDILNA